MRQRKFNIVKQRRVVSAVCSRCQSPDYTMISPCPEQGRNKPAFRCGSCGNEWSYGRNGGKYAELASLVVES
jgi:tRNA(Ile2) C34 agmatinyltransferase TiaS